MRHALVLASTTVLGLWGCRGPAPSFDQQAIARTPLGAALPPDFWLGVGASAYQTEGGLQNDWTEWEKGFFPDGTPHVANSRPSGRATDAWNLYPEDILAMQYLGANAYRMSIEWARLEPSEGQWDEAAIQHYRKILTAYREGGIEPLATVQHITLPIWVAEKGGWEWDGIVPALGRLGEVMGERFGDLVDNWCTINEPNALFSVAYVTGRWPPGVTDESRARTVYGQVILGHGAVADALRRTDVWSARPGGPPTFIGLAHNMVYSQAASASPFDAVSAGFGDELANNVVPNAVRDGVIRANIPGLPELYVEAPHLKGTFDYFGLNYYRRMFVRLDSVGGIGIRGFTPQQDLQSDIGWAIYTEGFYRMLKRVWADYGLPILITENGVADGDDSLRPDYLRGHIYAMERAIEEGVDVRGFYHWSLTDNFELNDGYTQKLGLFSIDFDNDPLLRRVPKPASVAVFREAARGMGLTPSDRLPTQ